MWEERWMKPPQDGGQVDSLVFNAKMVTVDRNRSGGKGRQSEKSPVPRKAIALYFGRVQPYEPKPTRLGLSNQGSRPFVTGYEDLKRP